jgi:hypothetical protein
VYLGLAVNAEKTECMFVSHVHTAGCSSAFQKVSINAAVSAEHFRLLSIDYIVKVSL